jgi:hypothetical protein
MHSNPINITEIESVVLNFQKKNAKWYILIIPALRRLMQEAQEFKVSLLVLTSVSSKSVLTLTT